MGWISFEHVYIDGILHKVGEKGFLYKSDCGDWIRSNRTMQDFKSALKSEWFNEFVSELMEYKSFLTKGSDDVPHIAFDEASKQLKKKYMHNKWIEIDPVEAVKKEIHYLKLEMIRGGK